MVNLAIEQRLIHYFLAMGAQQTDMAQIPQGQLEFLSGSERIRVVILKTEDIVQRNRMVDAILSLTSLRNSSQLLYLAAPRFLGASLDAEIFRSHGIGLLLFDERRIDEAVAPRPVESVTFEAAPASNLNKEVVTEILTLKSMYANMEQDLTRLRGEIDDLQRAERHRGAFEPTPPERIAHPESSFIGQNASNATLPPYFVNNPWLDVLSKRGRSDAESFAG